MDAKGGEAVHFAVLGSIEVRPSPAAPPLPLGSPLQRVLLGLLLTERDTAVSLDRIVDELWGEASPADPEGSVHTYVSRLRRVLEGAGARSRTLVRTPSGYRLEVPGEAVDAHRFAEQVAEAVGRLGHGDPGAALRAVEEAMALWRGPIALEDAGDRPFAVRERERLGEKRRIAAEVRLMALLRLGRPAEAIADADALVAASPLDEQGWVLLIEALHAAGRTADALARYTQVHRLLDDELGIAPGPMLREAQARVLRGEARAEPAPVVARPALIGRSEELAVLTDLVEGLPRSGPRFVLLDGEAGIGKSRLAAEVTAAAAAGGSRVAWGRCHEDDDAPALWPWRQVLTALTGDADAILADPHDGAFTAFERMLRALVEASAAGRVVVVLDDLHWADPASLRLLSFLAVELQHGPIAVLATCRPESDDPALAQLRATLARSSGFLQLGVGPLDRAATAQLVTSVAGTRSLEEAAVADLCERSGGNPFFATELTRVLAEGRESAVPPGVRDVVVRRLSRLPDQARSVLRLAAVAGQRFDVALLQRALADHADGVADALEGAEAAQLIRTERPGRLAFAHALVRESLLAEVPELGRSRLHARLAAALPESGDPYERAHHLVAGRPFTDAPATVAACADAAERAAREHAHENAARWWERALTTLDSDPDSDAPAHRQQLLLRAGTTLARAGSWDAATRLLSDAIEAALARGDAATAGAAAEQFCRLAGLWFPVSYDTYPGELVARLEAVLAAAGSDPATRVRAQAALATVCHYGPDRTRSRRESASALRLARETRREDLLITALAAQLSAAWLPGDEAGQIAAASELLDLAVGPERADVAVLGLARRSTARLALCDLTGGDGDLAEAWDLAQRHDLPLLLSQCVSMQAARAMLDGRFDTAMELVERAFDLTQRTQLYTQTWTNLVMRAFIWIDQGCVAANLTALPPEASVTGGAQAFVIALAQLEAGQPRAALAVMREHDGFRPWPMQWDWLSLTCWQARIAAELAEAGLPDPAVAGAIADRLLPYAGQLALHGGIGALGPVTLYLGRVEAVAGRAAAEEHLREAVETAERLGLRPSAASAHLALARLLASRGDRAAADEAARAADLAADVGMRLVERAARRLSAG